MNEEAMKIRLQWLREYEHNTEEEIEDYNKRCPPVSVEEELENLEACKKLERFYKEEWPRIRDEITEEQRKIKIENGLPEDSKCIICMKCRKPVQCDEEGNLYCDHFDERKTYTAEELPEDVIPIDMGKLI